MTQPIGYWCPLCGDLPTTPTPFPWIPGQAWHHGCCAFVAIPRFKPLDVPEVTTWGESGGAEAEWWSGFMSTEEARAVIKSLKGKP